MEDLRKTAEEWQALADAAHTLVSSLLDRNDQLLDAILTTRAELSTMRQKGPKMGMEGKREDNDEKLARKLQWEESRRAVEATEEQVRVLREGSERLEKENVTTQRRSEEQQGRVELARRGAPPRVVEAKKVVGQPVLLVLLDAGTAPWRAECIKQGYKGGRDMGTRISWEVENDIREHDIEIGDGDGDDSDPSAPLICVFAFLAKTALVENLVRNEVIRGPKVFDAFLEGFMATETDEYGKGCEENFVVDSGDVPVEEKMAVFLQRFASNNEIKRIYIAGVDVDRLRRACPELQKPASSFYLSVGPRLVLINHRESEEERDRLRESGWRVTVFRRYFGSRNGLGGDVGWGLPVTSGRERESESERREEGGWARTAEEGDEGFQRVGRKGTKHKLW